MGSTAERGAAAPGCEVTALVIAHEILGLNAHIERMRDRFARYSCDVHTPALFEDPTRRFRHDEQRAAVGYLRRTGGVDAMAGRLIGVAESLRPRYRRVLALGFSAGATASWIAANSGVFDAVVCLYGSRIRDHLDLRPACPCLSLFAAVEPGFSPRRVAAGLAGTRNVTAEVYDCGHGFCDKDNANHDGDAAEHALTRAAAFLGLAPVGSCPA
ncbi:dienelactone hydrolase family protein [Amycolatopsis palatopharyngis]|uniref:dienelactone hydrolase family protein n=1 Tax=Amycolatopsis palatopharyngis TaxID=187982 RepID=UPI000E2640F7|nr:dienelactone hydrolase family protein [Amycolatopsis palatopharyngis]